MENEISTNTFKPRLWKKIICVILSLIMAFGTFVSMTFSNLFLSDYIDFRNLITAYAAEKALTPVPQFYRYGELVGLYRVNYSDKTTLQYRIGDDGEWTDYSVPFAIPAHQTTKVYARVGTTGNATYKNFSTTDEALGVYTESNTDFEFSYNGINFGYTRIYDSVSKDWFESIHSKVTSKDSYLLVELPDASKYPMIRQDENTYIDEIKGYTLTKANKEYIFDDGQYKYHFAIKALQTTSNLVAIEDKNGNKLNLDRTISLNGISISDGTGRSFTVSGFRAIIAPDGSGALTYSQRDITDPNGNKIEYTTKADRYIEVKDQSGTILGKYEYKSLTDYTLIKSMDKSISYYDNGRLKQITYDNGSWSKYFYDDSNMSYSMLTSSGETTKTVYNDAFYPVESTDEYGTTTTYTYDERYNVLSEKVGDETTAYTYDANGNVLSVITGDAENDTYYTYDSNNHIIKEQTGNTYSYYTYDDNGNVLVSASLKEDYNGEIPDAYDSTQSCYDTITYTYDDKGNVTQEVYSTGETYSYEYDNRGNVTKETSVDDDGLTSTYEYTYDDMGNVTSVWADGIKSEYLYDAGGRMLLENENGECTRTIYDSLGRIVQEINPEDYDSTKDGLPSENTYADSNAGHRYVYNETTGNLDSETNRIGVTTDYTYYSTGEKKTESFDIYEYDYDIKGNITKVYVDGVNTLSYNYDENDNLISEEYANGQSIRYEYDDNGNCIKQYHDSDTTPYVTYTYNADNKLTQKINTDTGLKYVYGENNKVEIFRISDNTLVQSYTETVTEADEENGVEAKTEITESHFGVDCSSVVKAQSVRHTTDSSTIEYSYETDDDERISSDSVVYYDNTALAATYTYDDNDNIIDKHYSYKEFGEDAAVGFVNEYDSEGKITAIGYDEVAEHYTYDANDQLIRVDSDLYDSYTSTYSYDSRGNVVSKKLYDYTRSENITSAPTETTTFTYADSGWKDRLVAVNDVELTYDEIGNVLTYGDKNYTWNSGRNLESITDGENTYSYSYDENGIRTSKTVNGKTTYFNTRDGVILSQTDGTNTIFFQYDTNGNPLGFMYNGARYLYITNQMGDVVGIADKNGNYVAAYRYDEWGELLSIETAYETDLAVANANPLRYRGYYYDIETGYYYLQSRYYDPSICRFINADDINYASKDVSNGINIFAYCYNNPTNNSDPDGYVAESIAAALFTAAVVAAVIVTVLAVIGVYYTTSYILKNSDFSSVVSMIRSFGNAFKLNNIALIALLSVTIVPAYNAFKTRAKSKVKNAADALVVASAHAEIKTRIKNEKQFDYWIASLQYIGSYSYVKIDNGIDQRTAKSRMQRNQNVFCSSQEKARVLAKSSYNNKKPVGPETDKGKEHKLGYYPHYHVFERRYKSHAWFLS